ncbi:MAG: AAA family ATPase [Pontimonas sp.]
MSAHQTLAAGTPPAGRWKRLGFGATPVAFDLNNVFGMVVGPQNCGKSYLVQSNPDAFIINADDSPVVNPHGQACIWPARDTNGRIIDLDGKPMVLTWDAIEKKKQLLIEMAKANEDRPKCVVLDTLFPVIRLLKQHVTQQYGKQNFEDLHGPMAYERVYGALIEFALSLRQHGYGVWYVAHLSKKWVPLSETSNVEEYRMAMSDGLQERLSKTVEMIAPIKATHETKTYAEEQTITVGAKEIKRQVTKTRPVICRTIAFSDPAFSHLIRTRTLRPMPDVPLDEGNPWETFSRAFKTAIEPLSGADA